MLPGFPKTVVKTKIASGHYLLTRDDGRAVEVRRGPGCWYVGQAFVTVRSLAVAEYDLRHGYTAHDQLAAREAVR